MPAGERGPRSHQHAPEPAGDRVRVCGLLGAVASRPPERAVESPFRDKVVYETGLRRDPDSLDGPHMQEGRLTPALTCSFS